LKIALKKHFAMFLLENISDKIELSSNAEKTVKSIMKIILLILLILVDIC